MVKNPSSAVSVYRTRDERNALAAASDRALNGAVYSAALALTPQHVVERKDGKTGSRRALRARAGSRRGRPASRGSPLPDAPKRIATITGHSRLRSWTLQEPQIERREHQDNSDVDEFLKLLEFSKGRPGFRSESRASRRALNFSPHPIRQMPGSHCCIQSMVHNFLTNYRTC